MTGDVGVVGLVQKRDGSRLSSHVKIRMPISMDLAVVSCLRRLRQQTLLGASYLEIAGSNGIRSASPVFLSDRLISEGTR
jgi:hypothetical protein